MKTFSKSARLTNVLHPDKYVLLMFFVDKMTELVAATVPNVDLEKESERERSDQASGREQVKRSSVRNRPVEGDEQMAEKGRMATKVVRERHRYRSRKKNTLYLNKEQVRETWRQSTWHNVARGLRESFAKERRILTTKQM